MTVKLILFDFDGTIADTRDAFVDIVNELSTEFGYKPINQADVERLQYLSSREVIKASAIPLVKIPLILRRVKQELSHKIQDLQTIPGIDFCLFQLSKKGYSLGIVTSNTKDNVRSFLQNNRLDSLFNLIYSGTTLFGKDRVINKVMRKHKLSPNEVVYIGDETRDIYAAKKSKVKVIAVTWGFNASDTLAKLDPDFLIHKPQELMEIIENF